MKHIKTSAGLLYQSKVFAHIPWLGHGFGTRGIVLKEYLSHFGIKDATIVRTNQVHGKQVHILTPSSLVGEGGGEGDVHPPLRPLPSREGKLYSEVTSRYVLEGDVFVTALKNVVCFVRTADCVPILLCDPEKKVVGAVHAGWRGTACNVVGEAVRVMQDEFGCEKIMAAIGPCICPECYEVKDDVIESFSKNGFSKSFWKKTNNGSYNLDLKQANIELLKMSGLAPADISLLPFCTSCHNGDFASYRRDRSENSRQINFIFVK